MKKIISLLSCALIMSLLISTSCSEDDEKTRTELLTQKSWNITKAEIQYDGGTYDVTSEFIMECESDNLVTFSSDGKYSESAGADDCNGDDTNATGTWQWKNGEKTISTTVLGDIHDSEVLALTSSTLRVNIGTAMYDTDQDGQEETEVTIIFTLAAR